VGDRREPIFKDEADRARFLETLGQCCTKTDRQVHAWCLMNNHFHLVIERTESELRRRRKGDPKKVRIARRLREKTTMTLKWIAGELYMGGLDACIELAIAGSPWEQVTAI
jgi:REP element-mobilizing transposase RayT